MEKTYAIEICIGSSASRPVSFSMNPDPRPLIWTLQPVSAWISDVSAILMYTLSSWSD